MSQLELLLFSVKLAVCHSPDLYLDELRGLLEECCGVCVSNSMLWRTLRRSGFTMKKITKSALERNEEHRAAFCFQYGMQYSPQQTVFIDESSFDRRTSLRGQAWALHGKCALRKCFFVHGWQYVYF